jgi:hypothetical protein
MTKGVKHPSPFRLKLGFDEALERFARTKPEEVEELIRRSKTKNRRGPSTNARLPAASLRKNPNPLLIYAAGG